MSKGMIVLAVVAGLYVVGLAIGDDDPPAPVREETTVGVVTPEAIVDVMGAATVQEACDVYFAIGDYDIALDGFTQGYGTGESPSAEEVFDELLTRC